MTGTGTVIWATKDGRNVKVEIKLSREVQDRVAYADGWNIPLGRETVNHLDLVMKIDGTYKTNIYRKPTTLQGRGYADLIAKGAYAQLGSVYIGEENYNLVMAAIAELESEVTGGEEYAAVKDQEDAKEAQQRAAAKAADEHHAKLVASGLCPRCGTWCYGDCRE